MEQSVKICRNCKYQSNFDTGLSKCLHPSASFVDLVTGATRQKLCEEARYSPAALCGLNAVFHEPKE